MDTTQWAQGIGGAKTMESSRPMTAERKPRPQKEQALNCPRCNSTHTKFCYYNNYSLSQPRYFCKTCRRYWTEGGSLRNVPVGGGSRKNRRSTSSSSSTSPSTSSTKKLSDPTPPSFSHQSATQNPKIYHEGQDLNLSYPPTSLYSSISEFMGFPYGGDNNNTLHPNPKSSSCTSSPLSPMELLKSTGIASRGALTSFISMPLSNSNQIYPSSGFPLPELKPSLNIALNGNESDYGGLQGVQEANSTAAKLFFPFEDLNSVSSTTEFEQNRGQQEDSNGYWNGVLGGGSW